MNYQARQDCNLLAELYSASVRGELLLETPATEANIERFFKKYLTREVQIGLASAREMHIPPFGPGGPFDEEAALRKVKGNYRQTVIDTLNSWTNGVQQVIKSNGGNPDIFGYPDAKAVKAALESAVSKTSVKKAYKKAEDSNVPVVQETDTYIAYQPLTWEASRKYFGETRISLLDGEQKKGATWCTSASDPKKFNEYVGKRKDRLIYFIRKKDDKLFAARSMRIGTEQSENIYEVWCKKANRIVNSINKIQSSAEYTTLAAAAKKARKIVKDDDLDWDAHDAIHKFDKMQHSLYQQALALEPTQKLECRDQKNGQMWRLHDLLAAINGGKEPSLEEYIQFIKFVVFGKTE